MPCTRARDFDPISIFSTLLEHDVRFIAIGGWAAGAQDAGWPTYDADIVIAVDDENLAHVHDALANLGAEYESPHQRPIRPDRRRLQTFSGPQLFRTRRGRLDVLKEAGGETYETLLVDAVLVQQHGQTIRCASLAACCG